MDTIIQEDSTDITVTYDWTGQNFSCENRTKNFASPQEFYDWQSKNKDAFIWHVAGLYK